MYEIKYVVCFFLKQINNIDINIAIKFANSVAEYCNIVYNNFSFNTIIDGKRIFKNYKYKTTNIEKLMALDSPITTLSFDSLSEKKSHIDTNFTLIFSMPLNKQEYPTTISITIDPAILEKNFDKTYLIKLIEQVDIFGFDLEYGVSFPMETKKWPIFFLVGAQTPEMDQEEREIANALAIQKREYRNKIWDIFWYNIIKKELLTETVLDSIKSIVNRSNIVEVGDKYIIALPLEQYEYINNKEKLNKYRNRLRKIFSQVNMIMYEG